MATTFERSLLAADVVILAREADSLQVLLVKRRYPPFAGRWAIPGGLVEAGEPIAAAARRELEEETGVRGGRLYEFGAFGDPKRDPRGRVVSVAYLALVNQARVRPRAGDDAAEVKWFSFLHPPALAFDHRRLLVRAQARLEELCRLSPQVRRRVPSSFFKARGRRGKNGV